MAPELMSRDIVGGLSPQKGTKGLRQNAVLQLQRRQGNAFTNRQIVSQSREGRIQRVVISNAPTSETLHNTTNATSQDYQPNTYTVASFNDQGGSGNIRYEMTRVPEQ